MIKKAPKFSIIIPVYKRNDMAKEAVLSAISQTGVLSKELEIIISDDEDSKKIRSYNKKYFRKLFKSVKYSENKHEEGPGGNRQTGLDLAKGRYVVFLDSDDKLMPDFLAKMEKTLENGKYVAATGFSKTEFGKDFGIKERVVLRLLILMRDASLMLGYLLNKKTVYPSFFYLCHMSHTMFIGDEIKHQKFNYDYRRGGEDWDFFVQTLKKGPIVIVPKKMVIFRYSRGSTIDDPINRVNKWRSYSLLRSRLTGRFKKWPYYQLMGLYIWMFRK